MTLPQFSSNFYAPMGGMSDYGGQNSAPYNNGQYNNGQNMRPIQDPTPSRNSIEEMYKWIIATGVVPGDLWQADGKKEEVLKARRKALLKNPQKDYQVKGSKKYSTTFSLGKMLGAISFPRWRKSVDVPEKVNTSVTSDNQPLNINALVEQAVSGRLNLELPVFNESDLTIAKQSTASITNFEDPQIQYNLDTFRSADILASYPVQWPIEKCVRDLLQNFADAHGGTLDGVKLEVTQDADGAYEIFVRGKGEYSHKLLEAIGATTKKGKDDNSGGFGEGAKIMSLVMLREPTGKDLHSVKMAEEMEFSSNNWAYDYTVMPDENGEDCLYNRLRVVPDKNENYLRIKTKNKDFVEGLIRGLNYFRHSLNPDYFQKTYENVYGGFTYHGPSKKGNLYIVNQRTEYDTRNNWNNSLPEYTFWTNRKEELRDRDRSQVSKAELRRLIGEMAQSGIMPDKVLLGSIFTMQPSWGGESYDNHVLLDVLVNEARDRHLKAEFPEKYIAHSPALDLPRDLRQHIADKGYILCPPEMADLGMEQISRRHELVNYKTAIGQKPNKEEVVRMNILRDAAKVISSSSPVLRKTLPGYKIDHTRLYLLGDEEYRLDELDLERTDYSIIWLDRDNFTGAFFDQLIRYMNNLIKEDSKKKEDKKPSRSKEFLRELITTITSSHKSQELRQELQILSNLWSDSVQRQTSDPKWIKTHQGDKA